MSQPSVLRLRKSFGKITEVSKIPNLIEVQKRSFEDFLQLSVMAENRENRGLQNVFLSAFPVKDNSGKIALEFVRYAVDSPKYDVDECRKRGLTFSGGLRATLRLVRWDIDEDTGGRSVADVKEQDIYMGDVPLMTGDGTFIINGTERVIVSQMHRSPGVFFDHDNGKTHSSGKLLFNARIIPYRGSWMDFEFDAKDLLYIRIDRRRKILASTILLALGPDVVNKDTVKTASKDDYKPFTRQDILQQFYSTRTYERHEDAWKIKPNFSLMRGRVLASDLIDADTGRVLVEAGAKCTPRKIRECEKAGVRYVVASVDSIIGCFLSSDFVDNSTGEIVAEAGSEITQELYDDINATNVQAIEVLDIDYLNVGPYMRNTVMADKSRTHEDALLEIYRVLRPGEPPSIEGAKVLFWGLFFDEERYDLSSVGRVKMNSRLGFDSDDSPGTLCRRDVVSILKRLINLRDGIGDVDDIDHLGNRRVRAVGELLENQYRLGLLRMERSIRERMGSVEHENLMPYDLVNAKPTAAMIREFFTSSQLSQFMDQTNPLSEITHKRRLSALGPGGLTRDRASFEVRDVHPTHYGRICPIETPEGPNIGLINSLATYARVNEYGFIESPYRKVEDGKVTDEVQYFSAMDEGKYAIAQADTPREKDGRFSGQYVNCRQSEDFVNVPSDTVDYIDVSPKQLVSVAASLIPFLENDDANRALMGSNMQRQAVPLLRAEAPVVGTGMEAAVAADSGAVVLARRSGVVVQVDASRIVVRADDLDESDQSVDIYTLKKFQRSNQNTCMNQKPLVKVGQFVKASQVIADGPSTDKGELALGRNALVAFMSWNGFNFEDSIMISERVVQDDVFTSIHIEEFSMMARDTKLGSEEVTRDIPNVGEEALRNLDETGVVYIGAEVKPGDILVGKVTPKGETPVTPEEKLLRAIFGEKASDVKDSSLRLPPGVAGTVVDVRVFSRRGIEKDERTIAIETAEVARLTEDKDLERSILEKNYFQHLKELLLGQTLAKAIKPLKKGQIIDEKVLSDIPRSQWSHCAVEDESIMEKVDLITEKFDAGMRDLMSRYEDKVEKVHQGDELMPGVLKMVKVFVAVKRKLQPGDKMAGRHGNKGVISRITPVEDMPYLEDGTPVDIVLNPLGIPSRMNVGQVLETHLGWAMRGLGQRLNAVISDMQKGKLQVADVRDFAKTVYDDKTTTKVIDDLEDDELINVLSEKRFGCSVATPVFDGASVDDVTQQLSKAGLDQSGQVTLYDGRTGEPFSRKVTVGCMYILKLHHLVDDKIHARSIGPYSLVTQQPLGGKTQFGGQRFGEMEVWALEAYGASHMLQEMLTIKSDDVSGRTRAYESIIRGDNNFESGVPESFNVLTKEIKSLGLNIEFLQFEQGDEE